MKHDRAARDLSPALARFEKDRVEMILKAFKLTVYKRKNDQRKNDKQEEENDKRRNYKFDLLDHAENNFGVRRLTLASFYQFFPTFPIMLAARFRSRIPEHCSPKLLFGKFVTRFLFQNYLEVYCSHLEEANGRPIGMVVPFDYRGAMIVHNATDFATVRKVAHDTRQLKLVFDVPGDVPPHRITVEPFAGVIKYLARGGWTPKTPLPDKHSVQPPQVARGLSISPWMVERLGPSPALVILGWLRKVLGSTSGYDREYVRRLDESERCVKATHEQIIAETRLSPRQVGRGLADLRDKGFIITPRQHPSRILVTPQGLADEADAES